MVFNIMDIMGMGLLSWVVGTFSFSQSKCQILNTDTIFELAFHWEYAN